MKPAAALLLLAAACAHAQPQPTREPEPAPPTAAEVEQVAPTPRKFPQLDLPDTIDAALARAREAYRAGPITERVFITLVTKDDQQRTTSVLLRVDAGADIPQPRTRRVFLDLGRLHIAADSSSITAIAPREPALYYQTPVTAPLSLDQFLNAVPAVPLPQLEWALADDAARLGRVVTAILQTSWLTVQHTRTLGTIFQGEAPGGPAVAEFSNDGRLIRLAVPLSRDGDRIELRVTPEHPGDLAQWTITTEGRQAVPSLAELRPRPPEILPGSRLPALSLMTRDLDSWSLQDELDRVPEVSTMPTFGLVVAYRPAGPTAQEDAELGARAITIARTDVSHAQPDPTRRPRLVPLIVTVLDLNEMNRPRLVTIDDVWASRLKDAPPRYFSPIGAAEMDRLAKGSNAAVIIVDSTQKVLATLPLESRPDAEAVAQEIGTILDAATRFPEQP